ncbi:ABC transporter permease [Bradyrhizobium prioriisuperbiae]|uniref:ABC transporter permease n=1 Tax=Bradyrhizobium prioriisuperbiae TaxID=2854389 RepID=UPI0028EF9077|nr:ABC transporter permease [Bradyrhizobium prioritasuperba]
MSSADAMPLTADVGGGAPRSRWLPGGYALLLVPACVVVGACLVVPLSYVLALGFNPPRPGTVELSDNLTVANYLRFLTTPFYWRVVGKTIYLSTVTTALCAILGIVLACSIWRTKPSRRGILLIIVLSPLLVSIVTRTFGWMVVLGDNGLINSLLMGLGLIRSPYPLMFNDGAVIVGLLHVFLPLMVIPVLASLERIDPSVPQAASTLGAGQLTIALRIVLPLASPGLVAGITIVFSLSMSSYVTPALMGGPDSGMITTLIYQQFVVTFNWQFGSVLVAMLLATSMTLVGLMFYEFGRRTRTWIIRRW